MLNKSKIAIISLLCGTFLAGGVAFNALRTDAAGLGDGSQFGRGNHLGMFGLDDEDRKAEMEKIKAMTPEERQAYMEEKGLEFPGKGQCGLQNNEAKGRGQGMMLGRLFGPAGFDSESVSRQVTEISNGVQITVTSDDPEVAAKIKEAAKRINENHGN